MRQREEKRREQAVREDWQCVSCAHTIVETCCLLGGVYPALERKSRLPAFLSSSSPFSASLNFACSLLCR